MKIDQHPFLTNMLDAMGNTKGLTSETAEENASVDPRHQITTDDARGKGLIQEGTALGDLLDLVLLSPIGGIGRHGNNVKIGIVVSKRIDVEKKKDADKSEIGIKITGIARFSFTVGSKISSYQLSETALSAMVIISMIGQIDDSRTMIDALMS